MDRHDRVEPKTESTDDDPLAAPLPSDDTVLCLSDGPSSACVTDVDFILANCGHTRAKDVAVARPLGPLRFAVNSAGERLWDHQVMPSMLNTEFVVHGSHNKVNISTSGGTINDFDVEVKPPTDLKEKMDENANAEYDFVFCIATIRRIAPNSAEILAISKIDPNLKLDIKSDGSSLNGYAADHSSSSTNSICGIIEEQFAIPKIPKDSFVSFSSSSSSNGPVIHPPKSKPNNVLLSKNIYTYPENLVCRKCDYVYPTVSENLNVDNKDFQNKSQSSVERSKQKKNFKRSNMNNDNSSKRNLKKTKLNIKNSVDDKTTVKVEEKLLSSDMPIDATEQHLNEPISFDVGNKVLAYWVADKLFYPAIITNIVYPKFKVEFLSDYFVKSVNADNLVHSTALKAGCSIAIFDNVSQEYRVGEIISINQVPNGEETYTVDLDSEIVVVPFEKLVLDQENARLLQGKTVMKSYNRLSMSNISEGKRLRLSRSTSVKCAPNNSTKSSKRKIVKEDTPQSTKRRKCLFPEEPDPRNIPSTSTGITEEHFALSPVLTSEDSDFDHIREDLTTVNMHKLRNTDIDSEYSSPELVSSNCLAKSPSGKSIKVFKDLQIVLSYAKFKRTPMCNDSDRGTDNELPSKIDYFIPDKLLKKRLETLISKNGGTCHRYLNLIPKTRYKFTYIITDTPSQTCNFFLGLALGIPCYHHKYIEEAVSQKIPFADFLAIKKIEPIPNGWALESRTVVFRSPRTVHSKIFSGYIIYLALADHAKNEFFASLLRFCGAIVYTTWTNGIVMPLTRHEVVIVTDDHCPNVLVRERVPKLSILWVIQSLICESVRSVDGHESYIAINDVDDDDN